MNTKIVASLFLSLLVLPANYIANAQQLKNILRITGAEKVVTEIYGQNMIGTEYTIKPIGVVRSILVTREAAPHQADEGAPDAWIELNPKLVEGLEGITVGDEIVLITWLHKAHRDILKLHPRRDENMPLTGVFATRSPHRPNPLGLHRVKVLEITRNRLKVGPLEAIDGTPIVDIKPLRPQDIQSF